MTPEKIEQAHTLYEQSHEPINTICARVGISRSRLYYLRRTHGWKRPEGYRTRKAPRRTVLTLLRDMVEHELDAMARASDHNARNKARKHDDMAPDQIARTCASLVRTLGELNRLEKQDIPTGNGDGTEDIEILRGVLAQRLDTLLAPSGGGG
jgi:hypothetical protein